jgi:sigma-54 dependent transcriptional regulator, acetoin dehydrogenase operon transcriptional activator AcoR
VTTLRDALASLIGGAEPPSQVRQSISQSWQRSAGVGLDPREFEVPYQGDADPDGQLHRAARPVLERVADDLETAKVSVLVTDAGGHVTDRYVSDRSLRDRLDRIHLAPGFVYAEDRIGTNAIGTALADEATSVVDGDEHFADALVGMACAAAPIRDPSSGQLLGVVDLTSFAEDANALMLPLARQAARQLESKLAEAIPAAQRGWAELSRTERRIADLVARGCTNRQAADELFMSRYTVDFHLRSIFRKLGINSRVELARLVGERQTKTLRRN